MFKVNKKTSYLSFPIVDVRKSYRMKVMLDFILKTIVIVIAGIIILLAYEYIIGQSFKFWW